MNAGYRSRNLVLVVLIFCASAVPALADTIVLDGDDVTDWVRVFSSSLWKQKDSCIHPNSLLKFDLSQVPTTQSIIEARLYLFVERTQPGASIDLWHVGDDSWSYGSLEPVDVWNWPTQDLIATQAFQDTTSFSVDVTQHLIEEAQAGNRVFSIKITAHDAWYQSIRISSPLAPLERMRPRIVVTLSSLPPAALPDLAATQVDVRMAPMRPLPGEAVTLRARVRNLGPQAAANVPVAFWDGEPGPGNPPIGISIIPLLPAGGGAAQASVSWTCSSGLHEIHVAADPDGTIPEGDETNNADVRPFLIADPQQYNFSLESFEHLGHFTYHGDFDVPKQFEYAGPKGFYINGSGGEAYTGHRSTEMYLDGTADDGTIWVETAVPVDSPGLVAVDVSFELFRYSADIAFQPVAAVTLFDPEMEGDFTILDCGPDEGWTLCQYSTSVWTNKCDMIYVAVGLTCTWETPGTFYIDQIVTHAEEIATGIEDRDAAASREISLLQNQPNPFGPLTTIAYRLARPGPVSLQIFDSSGRLMTTIQDGAQDEGMHRAHWNGRDAAGNLAPSGVYLYRLRTEEGTEGRKLMLVR